MRGWIVAVALLAGACGRSESAQAPDLRGRWVFDASRADQLYVVSSLPEGEERQRALARVERDLGPLEVTFEESTATLKTAWSERTVHYEVVHWYGPLVEVVGRTDPYAPPVSSTLKLENDQLTWFDADGEIEFVLRR